MSSTVLKINLANLEHNYAYFRKKISSDTKMLAVVKAFSYGNDSVLLSKRLAQLGIDYLGVTYAEEGRELRENGIDSPILVLHPQPDNFRMIIEYNLEPSLYSFRVFEQFTTLLKEYNKAAYPIHIKFNSGMNRLGFNIEETAKLAHKIATAPIRIQSIFSHFSVSEDHKESEFTNDQIKAFKAFANHIITPLGYTPLLHIANTSGVLNYPEAHFSMVRTGLGLYGYGNEAIHNENLKPVASLVSKISQIQHVKKGDSIGYSRSYKAEQDMYSAVVPVGYADGIGRIYGNQKGFVSINNQKAFIVGNVCMDMIMVDVSSIDCKEGDEVIIFDNKHSADELAEAVGSITYELITGLGRRVKRVILDRGTKAIYSKNYSQL